MKNEGKKRFFLVLYIHIYTLSAHSIPFGCVHNTNFWLWQFNVYIEVCALRTCAYKINITKAAAAAQEMFKNEKKKCCAVLLLL